MSQTEKRGITPAELVKTLGLPESAAADTKVSGGQIESFRKGWAKNIMADSTVAHYFERSDFQQAHALCDVVAPIRWLYGRGNYERCCNCVRIMSRRIKSGVPV